MKNIAWANAATEMGNNIPSLKSWASGPLLPSHQVGRAARDK